MAKKKAVVSRRVRSHPGPGQRGINKTTAKRIRSYAKRHTVRATAAHFGIGASTVIKITHFRGPYAEDAA